MKTKRHAMKLETRLPKSRPSRGRRDSGIALITTLLILSIMSLIGLAMVMTVTPDMLINGYYRNYRSSFYAADSGLNIARQALLNQIEAQLPSTFNPPPVPTSAANTALSNVLSQYGSSYTSINAGQAAKSWVGSFEVTSVAFSLAPGSPTATAYCTVGSSNPSCTAVPNNYSNSTLCTTANAYISDVTACNYTYNYSLTAVGTAQGSEQDTVTENGSIIFNVSGIGASSTVSFAAFGAFINNYPPCLGPLVPGTMTGPMFTNGAWQFGTGGSYIFTDAVGQQNADADYWFGGTCIQSPTSSYKRGRQLINPTFQAGLLLGQPAVTLPPNAFSQEWAALDGKGQGESDPSPTNADKNSFLKNISGAAYPTAGATSGVYLNYNGSNQVQGGGFYVEGNAQVTLAPSGTSAQVYTVTQGSTTTTITVDPSANSGAGATTVVSGSTTLNLTGVPQNLSVSPATPATMLYVNGSVTGLTGPGQGQAAIQNNAAIDIAAAQNVTVTGDVIYSSEPVTTTQNQIPGTPADTLIPANQNNNEVLGIFTPAGNIALQSPYTNHNLEVDGSLAAISSSCASNSCGFTVNGYINTFNNIGGQIQSNIFGANMTTENTYFDRRFTARPGFAPPWFPSTTIANTGSSALTYAASVQRVQWTNTTALQ